MISSLETYLHKMKTLELIDGCTSKYIKLDKKVMSIEDLRKLLHQLVDKNVDNCKESNDKYYISPSLVNTLEYLLSETSDIIYNDVEACETCGHMPVEFTCDIDDTELGE